MLAAEIRINFSVRTMERGIVSAGCDLVIAESINEVWANWCKIISLKVVYESKYLRFLQIRFEIL